MKFYDHVHIEVKSGLGGDGCVTGRREKGVPFGGPSGGDGGVGGAVIFEGSKDEYTLMKYRFRRQYVAPKGLTGKSKQMNGRGGEDLILSVPLGTLIKDRKTGDALFMITQDGQRQTFLTGGVGGLGNINFTTDTQQYPTFALMGEPAKSRELTLELQLLGDVALIGTPSVGKSSLINSLANVKAKTAAYHFTTIVPNLGVVSYKDESFVIVDIPGLVAGAHEGKGMGNIFLRHILKARVFAYMLDMTKEQEGIEEFAALVKEIQTFVNTEFTGSTAFGDLIDTVEHVYERDNNKLFYTAIGVQGDVKIPLLKKGMLLLVNKYDQYDDEDLYNEYLDLLQTALEGCFKERGIKKVPIKDVRKFAVPVSAITKWGTDNFLNRVIMMLADDRYVTYTDHETFALQKEEIISIQKVNETFKQQLIDEEYISAKAAEKCTVWSVNHPTVVRLVFTVPRGNDEAEHRFWRTLSDKGILKSFEDTGVKVGDIFHVRSPYDGHEDRFIQRS